MASLKAAGVRSIGFDVAFTEPERNVARELIDATADVGDQTFTAQLEQLIRSLRAAQHEVLLVELPLLPLSNAYGRTQREIAARHGAILLPKRFLAEAMQHGTQGG